MSEGSLPTDEQCLQQHLDAHPGDGVTRLVLADLFEEQGRDDEAKAQRLLAQRKRWPDNDPPLVKNGWHWWSSATDEHRHRKHAVIPRKLQRQMPNGEWFYKTRLEAEAVFIKALIDAGEL